MPTTMRTSCLAQGWVVFTFISTLVSFSLGFASPLPSVIGPRIFDLTLTWDDAAPDGFVRKVIHTNGVYPGPVLEINQGEEVHVTLNNLMPFNTTIHFHGIEQYGTPWSDGVPGLSQRQIKTGESFTAKWTATQSGSFWYHAHQLDQLDDGLYGHILVHPEPSQPSPFSLINSSSQAVAAMEKAAADPYPLLLSDWRHRTADDIMSLEVASGIEITCVDALLFNGMGSVNCLPAATIASLLSPDQESRLKEANETALTAKGCMPAQVLAGALADSEVTNVGALPADVFDTCTPTTAPSEVVLVTQAASEEEKWLALDVVGTFGTLTTAFSIDELPMYVYAVDGDYITPQLVEALTVSNGDRYSVLVKLGTPGNYTIRMASVTASQIIAATATLTFRIEGGAAPFSHSTTPFINDAGASTAASVVSFNQAAQKAFPPSPIAQTADQTVKAEIRVAGESYQWALNETAYPGQLDNDKPLLFAPDANLHNNVTITTKNGTWVDLVFIASSFPMPPHPIHKHGNKMYLIGSGAGDFPWASVAEAVQAVPGSFNLVDPPRRDGFATPLALTSKTWMVVRYQVSNPGAWLVHCHIQSHLLGGMSMVIQDGIDAYPTIPQEYLDFN